MPDPSPMAKAGTSKDCVGQKAELVHSENLLQQPCSSKDLRYALGYSMNMPNIITLPNLSCKERYEVFTNEMQIADCQPSNVINAVHRYLEERLSDKKWLALWKGPYDSGVIRTIDILVEVDEVFGDQAHVHLVEPLVCSEPSLPYHVVEDQLNELGYQIDVTELYPISVLDNADEEDEEEDDDVDDESSNNPKNSSLEDRLKQETQQRIIARIIDNVRFFYEHIRRDWDEEDDSDNVFDAYLRARLRLHYDIINGALPVPLVTRYNRTMTKYVVRRKELLDFQARIQQDGDPSNTEAVECWKRYYEVLMLSGLLQIWESLQLRADGPCFPRVLRRTKGPRKDKSIITHIVCNKLTPSMVREFPDDANIKQHSTPLTALQQCHEGDVVLIFPGQYSGEGFHELTENITIRGKGNRDEVVIEAVPCDDLFVNVCASKIVMENITFVQIENTEGVLRIESGHAQIDNCVFKCDGTGVVVCECAELNMTNSLITGCRGSGVEVYQGSTSSLENNTIKCFNEEMLPDGSSSLRDRKGAVHLHVSNPPNIRVIGNTISAAANAPGGITIGRRHLFRLAPNTPSNVKITNKTKKDSEGGDASSSYVSVVEKVDESLKHFANIELKENTIEA